MSTTASGRNEVWKAPNLPPPKPFDGTPASWPKWRQRFEHYRTGSGLAKCTRQEQVSVFLYTMGDAADDIMTTMKIDQSEATFEELLDAFNTHYNARKNIIVERAKFNKRTQRQGEPVEEFIQDVHRLADECNFGTLKDELIRDRIVVGVADDTLSDELQSKAELTLTSAMQLSRQAEARKESRSLLRGDTTVNYVHKKYHKDRKPTPSQHKETCGYCGNESHSRDRCPAKRAECSKCHKKGHYQTVCRSAHNPTRRYQNAKQGRVHELSENEDDEQEDCFLGHVFSLQDDCWSEDILINNVPHRFKLDTGASVSVVEENWARSHTLTKSDKCLRGPGGTRLTVLGSFQAQLSHKDNKITETLYVLKGQTCSLLSRTACVQLGLISRVQEIHSNPPNFKEEFPQLFQGLGKLAKSYHITLDPEVKPVCTYTPRKIPHPLQPKVEEEINDMLRKGVISPVTEPTNWCSGIVAVPKPNGSVRICVDLTQLNRAVKREPHPMFSVEESLAKLSGSKIFSKLDARSGFWQIPLSDESKPLTTFITPMGRFCFNRLPFGISSASEVFQRTMTEILEGTEGVICHMDDVLVHAPDQATHDRNTRVVLQKMAEAGLTLNEKCEFSQDSITFLGHVIDGNGIHIDPSKVEAVSNFPPPTNIPELQRFMGMLNQQAKFVPNLAEVTTPLRSLLCKDTAWIWDTQQEASFRQAKRLLLSPPVLAHYSPKRKTTIAADASNDGVGAVLYQTQDNGSRRPTCFISRSLTDAEKNYATIEKEALAATWACERLTDYILGMSFTVETDHKPLVPLLNTTELWKMPPRIQRFRLRLMRYNAKFTHVAGKEQTTADALSRAPASSPTRADIHFLDETTAHAQQHIQALPASSQKLQEICDSQKADPEISQIREYCSEGWPGFMPHKPLLSQYWTNRQHLTIVDDLLLFDNRLVIPRDLRLDILDRLHEGHLGITKTRALASNSVWWPYISTQIEEMVNKCTTCAIHRPEHKEPLLPSSFPDRPWSRLGMDLFDFQGKTFIVVVDYYSRWIELRHLDKQTSLDAISKIKSIFAVHGIPDLVVSDNGPQFASADFRRFASEFGFIHTTSSPKYPQSNGEAERAVQTVKQLLKKAKDPYSALLLYRATPLRNGLSPSELLMGRKLKTKIPVLPSTLHPQILNHSTVRQKEEKMKEQQQRSFNNRHAAREASPLNVNDTVYIRDMKRTGEIFAKHHNPRSFVVRTEHGNIRRNRAQLVGTPGATQMKPQTQVTNSPETDKNPSPSRAKPQPVMNAPKQPTTVTAPRQTAADNTLRQATTIASTNPPVSPEPTLTPTQDPCSRSGRHIKKPEKLNL